MARDRQHIFITDATKPDPYQPHKRKIDPPEIPEPRNPVLHARRLSAAIEKAQKQSFERRDDIGFTIPGATHGVYLVVRSLPDIDLKLGSFDVRRSGIELMSVVRRGDEEVATVFVPDGKIKHFLKQFEKYATLRTKKGDRRYKEMVERISSLQLATLKALWTDAPNDFPKKDERIWWEVWLRVTDGAEEQRLVEFIRHTKIDLGPKRLTFPDRIVRIIQGTAEQLSSSIDVLNDFAELRKARELPVEFSRMDVVEQADWAQGLLNRLDFPPPSAPAVCILDTGVNRGHPLLQGSLSQVDMHTVDPRWRLDDHNGHGTEMAGLALFGDIPAALLNGQRIIIRHCLESVKILPLNGQNPPDLYGAITAEAVARVEVQAPTRRRGFSMSVTAGYGKERGQPTSWSAAVDALAAGRSFEPKKSGLEYLDSGESANFRLFVVCAGNIENDQIAHLDSSDTAPIQDPGQSWNAITVGACTEMVTLDPGDKSLEGYAPVAQSGDLSPYSSTSLIFDSVWPIKPDVVFEGGNKAHRDNVSLQVDDLSLLTTHHQPQTKMFVSTWGTSAATAQVARFAGELAAAYPNSWSETIRALIVHSAQWTPRMKAHVAGKSRRHQREKLLLRRYGFGVPNLDRARFSAKDALTLVVQDSLHPFNEGKICEMKVHALPWPQKELTDLGEKTARLRVTLSYFIEPNPARRGWRNRYRYASHGLRFDVMKPGESVLDFKKRLNQLALDSDEEKPKTGSDADKWFLGPDLRHHGSIHSDFWEGTAADLALRGAIGIFPVSGWWKDQPKHDRSNLGIRYALVASIETPEVDVDIWTPVAKMVGLPIEIHVN